jgi:Tfp pilus assembly protein PilF
MQPPAPLRGKSAANSFIGAAAAAVAAVAACVVLSKLNIPVQPELVGSGEGLFYPALNGIMDNWHMPLAPLLSATAAYPVFSLHLAPAVKILLAGLCVMQTFSLAALLCSPAAGLAAAVTAAFLCRAPFADIEQFTYSAVILFFANVLVYGFADRRRRDTAIGLACGATLLVKSMMIPFPALYLLWTAKGKIFNREAASRAVLLFGGAAIVIFVWGTAQFADKHQPVFLDSIRGESNIITGALGITGTAEGNQRILAGISASDSVARWALKTVATHPLRYLLGAARRCALVFSLNPLLLLLACAGFFACRKKDGAIPLALLALFFLGVHCLLTIEPRYLVPLWFMAAALAAGVLEWVPQMRSQKEQGAAVAVFKSCAVAVTLLCAAALFFVARYPFCHKTEATYERTIAANPDNAWLLEKYGTYCMSKGDADKGLNALERACELNPDALRNYSTALLASGRYEAAWLDKMQQIAAKNNIRDGHALIALMLMRLEQERDSDAAIILSIYNRNVNLIRNASGAYELKTQDDFRTRAKKEAGSLTAKILLLIPPQRMIPLIARVSAPGLDIHCIETAPYIALAELDKLDNKEYEKNPAELRAQAMALLEQGNCASARSNLIIESLYGDTGFADNRIILSLLLLDAGKYGEARAVFALCDAYEPGKDKSPHSSGNKNRLDTLASVRGILQNLPPRRMKNIALRLKNLPVSRDEALGYYFSLYPAGMLPLAQAGERAAVAGRLGEAAAKLERALALNPYYLPACLTLGDVYARQGYPEKLLALYKKTLDTADGLPDSYPLQKIRMDYLAYNAAVKLGLQDKIRHEPPSQVLCSYAEELLRRDNHSTKTPDALSEFLASNQQNDGRNMLLMMLIYANRQDYAGAKKMLNRYMALSAREDMRLTAPAVRRILDALPGPRRQLLASRLRFIPLTLEPDKSGEPQNPSAKAETMLQSGNYLRAWGKEQTELENNGNRADLLLLSLMLIERGEYGHARSLLDICGSAQEALLREELFKLPASRMIGIARRLHYVALDAQEILGAAYPPQAVRLSDAGVGDAQKKRYAQAEEELSRAIELNPYYLPAYLSLGSVYITQGRRADMLRLYSRAMELNADVKRSPLLDTLRADYAAAATGQTARTAQ